MIDNYNNECLYKDTLTIIEMMNDEMKSTISKSFIEFLINNQDINFEGTVNKNIPIKNQELRKEIKIMLSLMYINYFCDSQKKEEILKLENENINNFYNKNLYENINTTRVNDIEENIEETALVEYKENVWKKICNKIKLFFKKL